MCFCVVTDDNVPASIEIQIMRRITLGLHAPVILFVWKSETKRGREREEKQSVFMSLFSPCKSTQSQTKYWEAATEELLLFLMEFQSKWPITEWNSNLATNSQSFSLSNDCKTKYHIIHAHTHTPAQSVCEWEQILFKILF